MLANLAPAPAGTPIETNASNILPAAFCSATSSKGFILSKKSSTLAAELTVKPVTSISSAPKDTKPSGIFKTPDNIPASPASNCDIELSPSGLSSIFM